MNALTLGYLHLKFIVLPMFNIANCILDQLKGSRNIQGLSLIPAVFLL